MVRNFWNPDEIALPDEGKDSPPGLKECIAFQIGCDSVMKREVSVPITEEYFKFVGNAWELVMSYKPIWYDVEALSYFFVFCSNRDSMYKPACDAVDRLYDEIKNEGWNDDRIHRFKNLDALSREIHDTNPEMFVQEM